MAKTNKFAFYKRLFAKVMLASIFKRLHTCYIIIDEENVILKISFLPEKSILKIETLLDEIRD